MAGATSCSGVQLICAPDRSRPFLHCSRARASTCAPGSTVCCTARSSPSIRSTACCTAARWTAVGVEADGMTRADLELHGPCSSGATRYLRSLLARTARRRRTALRRGHARGGAATATTAAPPASSHIEDGGISPGAKIKRLRAFPTSHLDEVSMKFTLQGIAAGDPGARMPTATDQAERERPGRSLREPLSDSVLNLKRHASWPARQSGRGQDASLGLIPRPNGARPDAPADDQRHGQVRRAFAERGLESEITASRQGCRYSCAMVHDDRRPRPDRQRAAERLALPARLPSLRGKVLGLRVDDTWQSFTRFADRFAELARERLRRARRRLLRSRTSASAPPTRSAARWRASCATSTPRSSASAREGRARRGVSTTRSRCCAPASRRWWWSPRCSPTWRGPRRGARGVDPIPMLVLPHPMETRTGGRSTASPRSASTEAVGADLSRSSECDCRR